MHMASACPSQDASEFEKPSFLKLAAGYPSCAHSNANAKLMDNLSKVSQTWEQPAKSQTFKYR